MSVQKKGRADAEGSWCGPLFLRAATTISHERQETREFLGDQRGLAYNSRQVYRLQKRTFAPGLFELEMAGACDAGLARSHNEDAIALQEDDGRGYFFGLVCDGMGGYNAGEVASATAIQAVSEILQDGFGSETISPEAPEILEGLIQKAFHTASQRIDEMAEFNPDSKGMGCTAVVAVGIQDRVVVAHVGDSRAYLYDGSKFSQITRDHTLVQQMLDAKLIEPEEAETHPYAGHISRCIGHGKNKDQADFVHVHLQTGQTLMLCSDGLGEVVPIEHLARIVKGHSTKEAARHLIHAANEHGGPDNISAIVLRRVF